MAKRSRKRAPRAERLRGLIFDLEEPVNEAITYASALRLIGYGLITLDDDDAGRAVLAATCELRKRLDQIKSLWSRMLPVPKRGRS